MALNVIGALLLVGFGLCYWLNIFATLRALAAFVGTILIGTSGHLLHWAAVVVAWMVTLGGTLTAWSFGVHVSQGVTVIVAGLFIYDLWPKHAAGKRTGWAAIVLALMMLGGSTGFAFLNNVPAAVTSGVTSVQQSG
jgi:hypothetical protein